MISDLQIDVVNNEEKKVFVVTYSKVNQYTNRENNRSFKYYYGSKTDVPTAKVLKNLLKEILNNYDEKALFGTKKNDPYAIPPIDIRSQLTKKLKNMNRSHKGKLTLLDMDKDEHKTMSAKNDTVKIEKFGKDSIFKPEVSAKTACILGASFTGKTTFMVDQLNKLDPGEYDRIVLFTESTNADPLKNIRKDLDVVIFDRFCPSIPKLLKNINNETKNKFRFLLILDDCIELRNKTFGKLILTMRNSNISTVVLLQHVKLITPSSRSSLHNYYITGLRPEDWEYVLQSFLGSYFRKILNESGSYKKLADRVEEYTKGKIIWFDQRKSQIHFFLR